MIKKCDKKICIKRPKIVKKKIKCRPKIRNQIVTKLNKLKFWQISTTLEIETKLKKKTDFEMEKKNSKYYNTKKKLWQKQKKIQ